MIDPIAIKYLAAAISMLGVVGSGIGIGLAAFGAGMGTGRNPDAAKDIFMQLVMALAFAEGVAIFCFVIAVLILFGK